MQPPNHQTTTKRHQEQAKTQRRETVTTFPNPCIYFSLQSILARQVGKLMPNH